MSFWDDPNIDFLGIDAYFPLSSKKNPELPELRKAWLERLERLDTWRKIYGKPVILCETGFVSWDFAARAPWKYTGEFPYNPEIQANAYQALIDAAKGEAWLQGVFFWNWEPKRISNGAGRCTYSPQGKPTMDVLRHW